MASHIRLADHVRETRIVNERLVFAGIFSVLLFSVVIGRLAILQVMEYEHFDSLSAKNRVDINPLPPQRGLIYDRNGVLLAENIPTFSLELTPEKVSDLEQTLAGIAEIFELSDEEVDALKQHIKVQRRFKNIVIRQRLTDEEVAKFAVNRHKYNGVEVVGHLIRHYPHRNLFAHAIGYVGRINERDQQRIDAKNYKGTLQIGKTGVERFYEDSLHGTVGYKKVETNVQGRVVREIEREESISGSDLFLHFDINMQRLAAEALGEHNGAVVAMDPRDGGILALVSKPDFDPNDFVTGISSKKYSVLRDSPDRPLFDRALRGAYPPGSTLKPFVALAGLELDVVTKRTKTFDPGWFSLPGQDHRYRCWKKHGHGHVDLISAMAQSCDVYFYELANVLGIDRLHNFLGLFGFGHRTGVDLPSESKGLSPSSEWKRIYRNQPWYPGETLISGIGQGFNQTTPIQLAHATATLAMRGVNIQPQVLRAKKTSVQQQLDLAPVKASESLPMQASDHWEAVIDSMVEVVHGKKGTARHIGLNLPFKVAGKTGTAQVFGIAQDEEYDAETLSKKLHDHALFVAFAPAKNPELVVAIVVENGGSGSKTAAPIARTLIDYHFGTGEVDESKD